VSGPIAYAREDVQTIADLRMIALALLRRQELAHGRSEEQSPRHFAIMTAMRQIAATCEALIRDGPPAFRFIIEDSAPLEVIQHELRCSVFGGNRARRPQ